MNLTFPKGFLWGTATSSYQTEGNNFNSDWWEWEQEHAGHEDGPAEISGIACDSYNRYEEDFELAKSLNQNAQRISIEWSRIEPREGKFNFDEIEHYRRVLKAIKGRGMKTFVTLWHFSNPKWQRDRKGWGNLLSSYYFARYCRLIAEKLGSDIDYFATLNEPVVYITLRHLLKKWMPRKASSILDFFDGWIGLLRGHFAAYNAIKSVNPGYQVGIVENVMYIEPKDGLWYNKVIAWVRKQLQHNVFLALTAQRADFIGINYYFHDVVTHEGLTINPRSVSVGDPENASDWDWEIYPKGLYKVVKEISKYKKPMFITENGIADAKDAKRERFIVGHLYFLQKAISEGCDVRGYFHWSLIDNFEWAEGYRWKFGLIEVDREKGLKRKIRGSAQTYAKICRENMLSESLVAKYPKDTI